MRVQFSNVNQIPTLEPLHIIPDENKIFYQKCNISGNVNHFWTKQIKIHMKNTFFPLIF